MLPEISEASGEAPTNSLEEGKVDVEGSELSMHDNTSASELTKNKLGTLNGVFIPCWLNIMGIILFLRMGWGVGKPVYEHWYYCCSETMALLTVLSFSVVTNGNMAGADLIS